MVSFLRILQRIPETSFIILRLQVKYEGGQTFLCWQGNRDWWSLRKNKIRQNHSFLTISMKWEKRSIIVTSVSIKNSILPLTKNLYYVFIQWNDESKYCNEIKSQIIVSTLYRYRSLLFLFNNANASRNENFLNSACTRLKPRNQQEAFK